MSSFGWLLVFSLLPQNSQVQMHMLTNGMQRNGMPWVHSGWNVQRGTQGITNSSPQWQVIYNEEKQWLPNIGLKIKTGLSTKKNVVIQFCAFVYWWSLFPLTSWHSTKANCMIFPLGTNPELSFIYKFPYTKEQNVLADWIAITS